MENLVQITDTEILNVVKERLKACENTHITEVTITVGNTYERIESIKNLIVSNLPKGYKIDIKGPPSKITEDYKLIIYKGIGDDIK